MSNDSSTGGIAGALVGLAVLAAAVYFWRVSVALLLVLLLAILVGWAAYRLISKSGRAAGAIEENDFATGLKLLQEGGDTDQLISALRFKIPFPTETIKARMLGAVKEMLALREAAADPANPHVPEALREDLLRRTDGSLSSLWPLCQKLAAVTRARVKPEALKERLQSVEDQLADLATNAEATRHQLAHITLGATPLDIHEATEQMGAMKWQVTEMQRLDAMLER